MLDVIDSIHSMDYDCWNNCLLDHRHLMLIERLIWKKFDARFFAKFVIARRLMRGGQEFVAARWKSLGVTSLHKYCNAANIVANCYICIRM